METTAAGNGDQTRTRQPREAEDHRYHHHTHLHHTYEMRVYLSHLYVGFNPHLDDLHVALDTRDKATRVVAVQQVKLTQLNIVGHDRTRLIQPRTCRQHRVGDRVGVREVES